MTSLTSALPLTHRSLGDIVSHDSRAAAVLARFGVDFCCGGHQALAEAAHRHHAPLAEIIGALEALGEPAAEHQAHRRWTELDALTRHIIEQHHRYVRESTPTIQAWLEKLVTRHGDSHPELTRIRDTFGRLGEDLAVHMVKEESVLFSYIDELAAAARAGTRLPSGPFGTILNPVRAMEEDHRKAGELLSELRTLSTAYTPPDDACATYRACYAELARFEADLTTHVHLENHVLFPEAIELEERLI